MAASLETNKTLAALLTAGIIASGTGVVSRIIYHPHMPEENAYVDRGARGRDAKRRGGARPRRRRCRCCSPRRAPRRARARPRSAPPATATRRAARSRSVRRCGAWSGATSPRSRVSSTPTRCAARKGSGPTRTSTSSSMTRKTGRPAPRWRSPASRAPRTGPTSWSICARSRMSPCRCRRRQRPRPRRARSRRPPTSRLRRAPSRAAAGQQTAAKEQAPRPAAPEQAGRGRSADGRCRAGRARRRRAGRRCGIRPTGGVAALLAHADPDAGAKDARKCAACHSFEEGGPAKIGPPLWGVIGRDIASVEGFTYSEALAGKEGAWDYQTLDAFLAEPEELGAGHQDGLRRAQEARGAGRRDPLSALALATSPRRCREPAHGPRCGAHDRRRRAAPRARRSSPCAWPTRPARWCASTIGRHSRSRARPTPAR